MTAPLQGDSYGNVAVVFSAATLAVFVEMLNRANIKVDEDFLRFSVDEYTAGKAVLLVALSSQPNVVEAELTVGSLVTSIEGG